jgi:hypothetical protein
MIEFLEQRIAPAALHSVDLGGINGKNGTSILDSTKFSSAGALVEIIPDLNGDGIDDLLIGTAPVHEEGSAVAYVVYGRETPSATKLNLAKLKPEQGFKVIAPATAGGISLQGTVDLNGDGLQDLLFGAPSAVSGVQQLGSVIVLYGRADFGKSVDLSEIDAPSGLVISGAVHQGSFGFSVTSAGDVNNDGIDDLIVAAPLEDYIPPLPTIPTIGSDGAAYVIFGGNTLPATISVSNLDGTNGFALKSDVRRARVGFSVAGTGDLNGDGVDDIAVRVRGSFDAPVGGVYVVYGNDSGFDPQVIVTALSTDEGLRVTASSSNAEFGTGMAALGDVNGDGIDDLGIGGDGSGYVLYGSTEFGASINVETASADEVFAFRGTYGLGFRPLGDWNADGIDDFSVYTVGAGLFENQLRSAYVIFGSETLPAELSEQSVDGFNGFRFLRSGGVVSNGGDLNADGKIDLAFGYPAVESRQTVAPVQIYFGSQVQLSSDGRKATYSDPDGDLVTLKTSEGSFKIEDFTFGSSGVLQKLDLSDGTRFEGTKITMSIKRSPVGDGLTAIGWIDASGVDLASISVSGDLGRIVVGDTDFTTPALKTLSLDSLGRFAGETQPLSERATESLISGALGKLAVRHDVEGVTLAAQRIGALTVGGSILGTADSNVRILVAGMPLLDSTAGPAAIGSVQVKGDVESVEILAGYDANGVAVNPNVRIGSITVGGDWRASSVAVGMDAGQDGFFGTADDLIPTPGLGYSPWDGLNSLAKIQIDGRVSGTPESGDHFAITAHYIESARVSGVNLGVRFIPTAYQLAPTGDVIIGTILDQ